MKTAAQRYSDKLRDPRWIRFRDEYIAHCEREQSNEASAWCENCGEGTEGVLHVHHKRYINGREPWEYDYDDLRLLCAECHDLIHATEERFRIFVRTFRPHECPEVDCLLDELEKAQMAGLLDVACARARHAVDDMLITQKMKAGGPLSQIYGLGDE